MSDGADVRDLIPDDLLIRHVHIERRYIGEKRNFAASLARGAVIVHWDDDDFSAPDRISDQVARLLESGKSVTGYHSMRFNDGAQWWQYTSSTVDYALGTSLCYYRGWWQAHPFPPLMDCEDNAFVIAARLEGALIAVDAGDLMTASIHSQNTSPRPLIGNKQWTPLKCGSF